MIDVFIIGYCKCGTTSFAEILKQHPDVAIPRKEIGYYATDLHRMHDMHRKNHNVLKSFPVRTIQEYTELFTGYNDFMRFDCSTTYIWSAEALEHIKRNHPNAQIIIFTRDKEEWKRSYHAMMSAAAIETRTYEQAMKDQWKYSTHGLWGSDLYYDMLAPNDEVIQKWKNAFPASTKIIRYEEFKKDNIKTVEEVVEWLALSPYKHFYPVHHKQRPTPRNQTIIRIIRNPRLQKFVKRVFPERYHKGIRDTGVKYMKKISSFI